MAPPLGSRAAVLALLGVCLASATPEAADKHFRSATVEELTEETFDTRVRNGEWFIKFYAPWCGHCRNLAPTWHEVGDELNDTDGVHVGQVDCVRSKALCSRYGVRGFPTLKHFSPGEEGKAEVRDYSGSRTTNALVEYAKGGWEAAQPSRVGDQAQDGDGPGLIHDMMDFAGRHMILTALFFAATAFVLVAVVLLVLDMTGAAQTEEGLALRSLVDPETGIGKEA